MSHITESQRHLPIDTYLTYVSQELARYSLYIRTTGTSALPSFSVMAPRPENPPDSEEVDVKVVTTRHDKEANRGGGGGGPNLLKLALTGTAIVGGVIGLWWLYKRFIAGKRHNASRRPPPESNDGNGATRVRMTKRDFNGEEIDEKLLDVYETALQDEGFLGFLEELGEAGLLNELES